MPTDLLPNGLAITHPNFSYHANVEKLPEMSTEMFWWLKGHYDLSRSSEDAWLKRTVFETTNDSTIRCVYAAMRIYRPVLAENARTLTPYGSEVANKVNNVVIQSGRDPMEYHKTLESDLNFITVYLTWRMLGLLFIMDKAIEKARADRMKHLEETNSLPPNPPIAKFMEAQENIDLEDNPLRDPIAMTERFDIYKEENITVHSLRYGKFGLAVYVPAVALGDSKGRSDSRQLVKLGILDARTIRDGTRGRAKLGLTVSSIGKQLIKDLANKGLISQPSVL